MEKTRRKKHGKENVRDGPSPPGLSQVALTGFSAAIEAVFPKTEIQNRIIHQIRNSTRYVSYKDLKALVADLKAVYAALEEPSPPVLNKHARVFPT